MSLVEVKWTLRQHLERRTGGPKSSVGREGIVCPTIDPWSTFPRPVETCTAEGTLPLKEDWLPQDIQESLTVHSKVDYTDLRRNN